MQKKIPVLDTNVLVRFLVGDSPRQKITARHLFEKSSENGLQIPDVIIFEIVHVLQSFYRLEKQEIIEKLSLLISFDKFKVNRKLVAKTLDLFQEHQISFVDAYLAARVLLSKNSMVYTFDKGILKLKEISSKAP